MTIGRKLIALWLPAVFVVVHTPDQDQVRIYRTQTQTEVTTILNAEGNPYDIITKRDATNILDAAPVAVFVDSDARRLAKIQARLDVKNGSLTQAQRLQALLILLDFDQ